MQILDPEQFDWAKVKVEDPEWYRQFNFRRIINISICIVAGFPAGIAIANFFLKNPTIGNAYQYFCIVMLTMLLMIFPAGKISDFVSLIRFGKPRRNKSFDVFVEKSKQKNRKYFRSSEFKRKSDQERFSRLPLVFLMLVYAIPIYYLATVFGISLDTAFFCIILISMATSMMLSFKDDIYFYAVACFSLFIIIPVNAVLLIYMPLNFLHSVAHIFSSTDAFLGANYVMDITLASISGMLLFNRYAESRAGLDYAVEAPEKPTERQLDQERELQAELKRESDPDFYNVRRSLYDESAN